MKIAKNLKTLAIILIVILAIVAAYFIIQPTITGKIVAKDLQVEITNNGESVRTTVEVEKIV
jgi:uncharacterized protein YxeA